MPFYTLIATLMFCSSLALANEGGEKKADAHGGGGHGKEKKADASTSKSKHEKGESKAEEKAEHEPVAKKAPAKKDK